MRENLIKLLENLTRTPLVCGHEHSGTDKIKKLALDFTDGFFDSVQELCTGTLLLCKHCGKQNAKKLVFDAHIDSIGFCVTQILDGGFVRVSALGGIDENIVPSGEIVIHGKEDILAFFVSIPPHLSKDTQSSKTKEFIADTGYTKEKLLDICPVGSPCTFRHHFTHLCDNKYSSIYFDNRICMAGVLQGIKLLCDERIKDTDIYVCFSSGEEKTMSGASAVLNTIDADAVIVLDVNFAKEKTSKNGEYIEMSKGSSVSISATTNVAFSNSILECARKNNIPCQKVVEFTSTGTNANILPRQNFGCKCAVLSIPIKYMHTSVETADLDDVMHTANLIKAFALEFDKTPFCKQVYIKKEGK